MDFRRRLERIQGNKKHVKVKEGKGRRQKWKQQKQKTWRNIRQEEKK